MVLLVEIHCRVLYFICIFSINYSLCTYAVHLCACNNGIHLKMFCSVILQHARRVALVIYVKYICLHFRSYVCVFSSSKQFLNYESIVKVFTFEGYKSTVPRGGCLLFISLRSSQCGSKQYISSLAPKVAFYGARSCFPCEETAESKNTDTVTE